MSDNDIPKQLSLVELSKTLGNSKKVNKHALGEVVESLSSKELISELDNVHESASARDVTQFVVHEIGGRMGFSSKRYPIGDGVTCVWKSTTVETDYVLNTNCVDLHSYKDHGDLGDVGSKFAENKNMSKEDVCEVVLAHGDNLNTIENDLDYTETNVDVVILSLDSLLRMLLVVDWTDIPAKQFHSVIGHGSTSAETLSIANQNEDNNSKKLEEVWQKVESETDLKFNYGHITKEDGSDGWKHQLGDFLELLILEGVIEDGDIPVKMGSTRYLLNREPVNANGDQMVDYVEVTSGIYAETNGSTARKIRQITALVAVWAGNETVEQYEPY